MHRIEYFYSLMSPFTYLAGLGLEQVAASHGAEIIYRPADIARVFAETGGLPVPKRHPTRQEYRLQELKRLSKMHNRPLNMSPKHWPVDATKASCTVIAADAAGGDAGVLNHAFLKACWAEERDISDDATIATVLDELGYDPKELSGYMSAAETQYEENTRLALKKGVFGAPFYIVGEEKFWGQDRLGHLDWHLSQLAAK